MSDIKPPEKPRKDFPLFAHRGGSWTAKIDGQQKSFGGWRNDPHGEKAIASYNRFISQRAGGSSVPIAPDDDMAVRALVNRFLTRQAQRLEAGEIKPSSFRDFKSTLTSFVSIVGGSTAVADLSPAAFANVRVTLGERMGSHALNRHITVIKQLFRWGDDQGFISRAPKYGEAFKKARHGRSAKPKMFAREEIWQMIIHARQPMRTMILLGLNCGLGNTDIGHLRRGEIDLDGGMLDNHRRKTDVVRRCPLWPETVESLRQSLDGRKVGSDDLVFVTRYGNPWVQEPVTVTGRKVEAKARTDSVRLEFTKVLIDAGIFIPKGERKPGQTTDGRNFYTLRRTFRTLADNVRDPHATALMMGHSFGSVAGLYVQHIDDSRLRRVADYVRGRLFGGCTLI